MEVLTSPAPTPTDLAPAGDPIAPVRVRALFALATALGGFALVAWFPLDRVKYALMPYVIAGAPKSALPGVALGALGALDYLLVAASGALLAAAVAWEVRGREVSRALACAPGVHVHVFFLALVGWFAHAYLHAGYLLGGDIGSHVARTGLLARGWEAGQYTIWSHYWYLGSPLLQIEAPLYYWLTAAVDVLVRDPNLTTKLALFALHVGAALSMRLLLSGAGFGRFPSFVGALAYSGTFIHLHAVIWRGQATQALTFVLLPLALHSLRRVCTEPVGAGRWAALTLVNAALMVNHQVVGLYAWVYVLVWAVALGLVHGHDWRRWAALGASGITTVALSLFVIVPGFAQRPFNMMPEDPELFYWQWPSAETFRHFFVWSNTKSGNFDAYLGLSVVALATWGAWRAVRPGLPSALRALAIVSAVSFVLSLGLKGGHLKEFVFPPLFLAILAAVGAWALTTSGRRPARLGLIVFAILLDLGPTAVQPLARTDKTHLDRAAAYLAREGERERVLVASARAGAVHVPTGSVGLPLIYHPIQHLIGPAAGVASLAQNYTSAVMKMAERDLNRGRDLTTPTRELLSLLNVRRVVHMGPQAMGFPAGYARTSDDGPLGPVIPIPEATPVVFAPRLVKVEPPGGLDKPYMWDYHFDELPDRARRFDAFLLHARAAMELDLVARSAAAIPVRRLGRTLRPGDEPTTASRVEVRDYRVAADRVVLRVATSSAGYLQIAHAWYPSLRVTRNGQPVETMPSSMNLIVVAVPPGEHEYRIDAALPAASRVAQLASLATLIAVGVVTVAGRRGRREAAGASR